MTPRGTRRQFLGTAFRVGLALVGLAGAACARPAPAPTRAVASGPLPLDEATTPEARRLLLAALVPLRTYDAYAAYRVGRAPRSALRAPGELPWEPPSAGEWARANQAVIDLQQSTRRLHEQVAASTTDPLLWRERRALADATHALQEMAEALGAYRAAVEAQPAESDGGPALPELGRAWERWQAGAARWQVSRYEAIACA